MTHKNPWSHNILLNISYRCVTYNKVKKIYIHHAQNISGGTHKNLITVVASRDLELDVSGTGMERRFDLHVRAYLPPFLFFFFLIL